VLMGLGYSLSRWSAAHLYRLGLTGRLSAAAAHARPAAFPVLTYHRVNDDRDPFFEATPIAVFEAQMAYLAQTSRVLTVEDLVDRSRRGDLPRNAIAITFDDGYRDNLLNAAPILHVHGLPATIFIATGAVGTGHLLWFDRLALAFRDTKRDEMTTRWSGTARLGTRTQRLAALNDALHFLKSVSDTERRRIVDDLLDQLGPVDEGSLEDIMLDWGGVAALRGLGFNVGAHTVDHPILSRMDVRDAELQIVESRRAIESMCGVAPASFAYPNGSAADYNSDTVELVRRAGFTCAVTTRVGLNTTHSAPYELRRGGPWAPEISTFALQLACMHFTAAREDATDHRSGSAQ